MKMSKDAREALIRKLRINVKSLAAEARFNRIEKHKASKGWIKWDLDHHRTGPLRHEARITQLAYAFVRGVPYRVVENKVKDPSELEYVRQRVKQKLQRFGFSVTDSETKKWFNDQPETCAA